MTFDAPRRPKPVKERERCSRTNDRPGLPGSSGPLLAPGPDRLPCRQSPGGPRRGRRWSRRAARSTATSPRPRSAAWPCSSWASPRGDDMTRRPGAAARQAVMEHRLGCLREAEFPVTRHWAYFDHAAVAPLPRRSGDALRAWTSGAGAKRRRRLAGREEKLEAFRDQVAGLINAHRDEIAFVNSTTHGIGLIAEGFPWRGRRQRGDRRRRIPLEHLSLDEPGRPRSERAPGSQPGRPDLARGPGSRPWIDSTRVLAISHVEFATGFRNDLDALAASSAGARRRPVRRRDPGAGAVCGSTSSGRRSTSWPPTATSGCWGRRGRGCFTCAATGSTGCGRSASAGTASSARTIRRDRVPAQAQCPALGRGLVQHGRASSARRQREPASGAGAGRGFAPHRRSGRGRARAGALAGWRVTGSNGRRIAREMAAWRSTRYASTSTSANCPVHPWLRLEDGRSAVSTFGPSPAKPRVGRVWVVPGPGGQLDDPGTHRVVHREPGQARTPVIEDPG